MLYLSSLGLCLFAQSRIPSEDGRLKEAWLDVSPNHYPTELSEYLMRPNHLRTNIREPCSFWFGAPFNALSALTSVAGPCCSNRDNFTFLRCFSRCQWIIFPSPRAGVPYQDPQVLWLRCSMVQPGWSKGENEEYISKISETAYHVSSVYFLRALLTQLSGNV